VSRSLKLAGAPITWGICEVPGWGEQLGTDRVLAEIARSGLSATELGPRGFLSEDARELRAHLARHGLSLVGGFVPAVLHRADILAQQLALVDASAATLAGAGAEILILAAETGAVGYEFSLALSDDEWETLRCGVASVQEIGTRRGLEIALHPHYGTVIERDDQIRRLLATTDVALCLDTGHLMVGGADPTAIVRAARGRISHVHLKDVDSSIAARVRAGEVGYRDAVHQGMYRPLGDGDADVATIVRLLREDGYDGWYVIEQDLVIDGARTDDPLENATRSVRFLDSVLAG
jgi:inosose dehydratase